MLNDCNQRLVESWYQLPNATHINRIATSRCHHKYNWYSAWDKWDKIISAELREQAWDEAEAKCMEMGRWGIWLDSGTLSINPVLALITYDDCAHYLEYTSEELTTIALLGVAPAVLLLPMVLAFEDIAKISA